MKYTANETIPDGTNGVGALQIPPEQIAGYVFKRSPKSHFKFNIFAIYYAGDFLYCYASDLDFEKASSWVDALNREYYPEVPTPTETVFVEIGGESKVYNITATK